ncbi:MAG: DUF2382 domain-containing protein [Bacteroidota bacterium]
MSNEKRDKYRLAELAKSDFEIADGEPDIRGWKVKNMDGRIIGEVIELLFDPLSRSVRYLIMHIEGKSLNLISRNVLIPIGLADIHEEIDEVTLPTVTVGHLATLPAYKRNGVTPSIEKSIRSVFSGETSPAAPETVTEQDYDRERFYQDDLYDEDRMFNRRRNRSVSPADAPVVEEHIHTAGGRRIVPRNIDRQGSKLSNDPVTDNTRVHQTRAEHENYRHPEERHEQRDFTPFQEGTIEITEHKEVPVVSKDTRVVEEVSIHKDVDHRDETIRDTVRHTEVDIEEFDGEGRRRRS